jgi:hypothetical protein
MPEKDYSARPLIDKLGIKVGARVAVLGVSDEGFLETLIARTPDYSVGKCGKDCDVILLGVADVGGLRAIEKCKASLKPAGGLWVIYPKGRKDITQAQVMEVGLASGLVDNKVASFSTTLTAMRFVIRLADRKKP